MCVCGVCASVCQCVLMARWELRKFTVINGLHDNTEWLNYLIGSEPVVKWRFNCGVERFNTCSAAVFRSEALLPVSSQMIFSLLTVFSGGTGYKMQACAAY